MPGRSLGGKQNVSSLRFRTSGPGKARRRSARRSAGRGSGLRACRASSAMPLRCLLLNGRLQPALLRSGALASAQSRSSQGSRRALAWSARSGPGARADAATVSVPKRARAEDGTSLRFVRLSEHATAPTRGSTRAAGYDLYSAYDYTISPMEKAIVKTDIQIAVPSGCYGRVAPRSGLTVKHFIDVGAGVIDEDYRGNVGVVLFNFGKEKFEDTG
ncbi:deoxyuridine 5'-triphosphate nucleotidohydrolase, mitochondrial isoform X2 [Arvicanthis niloticus]|uniref:deoxyuridine 5'-triphosphate nucleotidohydrolase, mitochondrial isoform X2 n=1 Tax=Arvicanthis niloticus TaxID=61156 RepID=UPI00402BC394